jgi:hypothetical protein
MRKEIIKIYVLFFILKLNKTKSSGIIWEGKEEMEITSERNCLKKTGGSIGFRTTFTLQQELEKNPNS